MSDTKHVRFSFRVPRSLMVKLSYIAEFEGRSKHEEIERMLYEWVRAFEEAEGEIILPERALH